MLLNAKVCYSILGISLYYHRFGMYCYSWSTPQSKGVSQRPAMAETIQGPAASPPPPNDMRYRTFYTKPQHPSPIQFIKARCIIWT